MISSDLDLCGGYRGKRQVWKTGNAGRFAINDKNVARDNELYLPGFDFSLSRSNISAIARVTPYKLKRAVEEAEEDVSRLPAAHYIKCN